MKNFTLKIKTIISIVFSLFLMTSMSFGQSLNFDGIDDYATIPNTGTGILGDYSVPHSYTIEVYFKFTGTPIKRKIFTRNGGNNYYDSNFFIETTGSGNLKIGQGTDSGWISETGGVLQANTWYHVAMTVDMNTLIMNTYLDGVEFTIYTDAFFTANGLFGGWLGAGYTYTHVSAINTTFAYSEEWGENGSITFDYVRIWDHVRTSAEIAANYELEVSCGSSGLMANFSFNDGIGGADNTGVTSISDCTGNGYNATLTNMSLTGLSSNFVTETTLLPVELTYFEANKSSKTSLLTWETASEENNKGFHIEHSTNGKDFEKIDWVDGYGSTTEVQEYEFIHKKPNTGVNYYRLIQEDFDGTISHSEVRTVLFEANFGVTIYPNPSKLKERTNIQFVAEGAQKVNVSVFEMSGKQILSMNYNINEGNNTLPLSHDLLNDGVYIISITHDGGTENVKLSIVK